jgi:hypothetical protein
VTIVALGLVLGWFARDMWTDAMANVVQAVWWLCVLGLLFWLASH